MVFASSHSMSMMTSHYLDDMTHKDMQIPNSKRNLGYWSTSTVDSADHWSRNAGLCLTNSSKTPIASVFGREDYDGVGCLSSALVCRTVLQVFLHKNKSPFEDVHQSVLRVVPIAATTRNKKWLSRYYLYDNIHQHQHLTQQPQSL